MKNQFTLANVVTRSFGFASASASLLLLVLVTAASSSSGQVLQPSSLPYGYSYEEWSAKFWQWTLGQSTNHYETLGKPDICSGPASRVRFPGPSKVGAEAVHIETNHITIDAGTPLFFPILALWSDNSDCPLSAFTTFTSAQLVAMNAEAWSAVTETSCTIDGVAVEGMEDPTNSVFTVVSPAFSYTTAEKDNVLLGAFGATCIPGDFTIYPAEAVGMYVMLAPLKPGRHTIHCLAVIGPSSAPLGESDKTIEVRVLPP
jgi:hypothetical protein